MIEQMGVTLNWLTLVVVVIWLLFVTKDILDLQRRVNDLEKKR